MAQAQRLATEFPISGLSLADSWSGIGHAKGMRSLSSFPVFVAAAVVAVIAYDRVGSISADATSGHDLYSLGVGRSGVMAEPKPESIDQFAQNTDQSVQQIDSDNLLEIEAYEDLDYGFSVAIPSGWQKIVAAESEEDFSDLEPGYAVGFESPYQGGNDKFADYVLIEVLPGKESGLFETDGQNRRMISIDGQTAWMDRLDVEGENDGLTDVDLTIFQAEMSGLGYTVGLYAIGEPSREKLMSDAFKLIVQTFRQTSQPFPTS